MLYLTALTALYSNCECKGHHKVSVKGILQEICVCVVLWNEVSIHRFVLFYQAKILDHDNVNYLKKILVELAMVLDQVEAELEKRKLEYQGKFFLISYTPGG